MYVILLIYFEIARELNINLSIVVVLSLHGNRGSRVVHL